MREEQRTDNGSCLQQHIHPLIVGGRERERERERGRGREREREGKRGELTILAALQQVLLHPLDQSGVQPVSGARVVVNEVLLVVACVGNLPVGRQGPHVAGVV